MKFALVLVCGSVLIMSEMSICINAQKPQIVRGTIIGVGIPGIREIGPEELGGQQGKEGQSVGQGARGQGRGIRPELGVTVGAEAGGQSGEQAGEINGVHVGLERNHTVGHQGEKGESGEQGVEGEKRLEVPEPKAAAEGAKTAASGEVGVNATPVAVAASEGTTGKEPASTGARGMTTGRSTQT